jgi:hypothetical protein
VPAQVHEHIVAVGRRRERAECLGVAVRHTPPVAEQECRVFTRSALRRRNRDRAAVPLGGDEEPEGERRAALHPQRQPCDRLAVAAAVREFDAEGAERARPGCHPRDTDRVRKAERRARCRVEWGRGFRESATVDKRAERVGIGRVREEARGVGNGKHAPTLGARAGITGIGSLPE